MLIPSSPGALNDLAENEVLAALLNRFIEQKSKSVFLISSGTVGYSVVGIESIVMNTLTALKVQLFISS